MRQRGKITTWKDDQGFGFIAPEGGGEQVFVHIKAFADRRRRPVKNDAVTFDVSAERTGRTRAVNVAFANSRTAVASSASRMSDGGQSGGGFSLGLAALFLLAVTASALGGKSPMALIWLYPGASVLAFCAYALDKSAAQNGRWRTKESTLHLIALAGGWPGALAAQKLLRHKSRKRSFQFVFWVTVVVNCGTLAWLHTPRAAELLRSFPG